MFSQRAAVPGRGASEAATLVTAALSALEEAQWGAESDARELPDVRAILDAPEELRRECLLEIAGREEGYHRLTLLSLLARKRVQLTADDIEQLLSPFGSELEPLEAWRHSETVRVLSRQLERAYSALSEIEQERLKPFLECAACQADDAPTATRLRKLVGAPDAIRFDLIDEDDDVGHRLRAVLQQGEESEEARAAVLDLLAAFAASGRAGKTWRAEAGRVCGLLSQPTDLVAALLDAALDAADTTWQYPYDDRTLTLTRCATEGNESLLCGAALFAGLVADPALLPRLRRLALKSVAVIVSESGIAGPRSLRLANASAQAIAEIGAPASITELLALERAVRHGTLLKQIRRAIDALAAAQGMTRDELLERAVERHDLDSDGRRRVPLSRGTAVIDVEGGTAASLVYLDDYERRRKSIPAEVKAADAETLAALREDLKAIRKTIAGERQRLDRLSTLNRTWAIDDWRSLYLEHPITGRLTRALIWGFGGRDGVDLVGMPRDATTAVTSSGEEVAIPAEGDAYVWHPITASAEDVRAWRLYLLEQAIAQPFKQAFRELYVVTPAELETRVYSNRFAGHVFGQVQARALMKGRGWRPLPVAWWDDGIEHGVARRAYEAFAIRAEFFFDPALDIEPLGSGLYPYCTSDQVRFVEARSDEPVALADVPPVVFTEAMRDVDLFIGVTSIGADPEWLDRGHGRRFENYWHAYSFGELTAAGEIRRQVLEQLLPRLAIADRCELEERYLVVRGDLRTYRVHLGSGNVLMSPNDQYLCIVATRDSRAQKLFIPFDDDPVLSVILSKAFLLAEDSAIKDPTITAQISCQ